MEVRGIGWLSQPSEEVRTDVETLTGEKMASKPPRLAEPGTGGAGAVGMKGGKGVMVRRFVWPMLVAWGLVVCLPTAWLALRNRPPGGPPSWVLLGAVLGGVFAGAGAVRLLFKPRPRLQRPGMWWIVGAGVLIAIGLGIGLIRSSTEQASLEESKALWAAQIRLAEAKLLSASHSVRESRRPFQRFLPRDQGGDGDSPQSQPGIWEDVTRGMIQAEAEVERLEYEGPRLAVANPAESTVTARGWIPVVPLGLGALLLLARFKVPGSGGGGFSPALRRMGWGVGMSHGEGFG